MTFFQKVSELNFFYDQPPVGFVQSISNQDEENPSQLAFYKKAKFKIPIHETKQGTLIIMIM